MDDPKCPDCDTTMVIEVKGGYEQSTQYEAHCPNCLLSYSWWDTEFNNDDERVSDEFSTW